MQIILTHEQADFDAIASMLGAKLLQENAVAVLPSNINRNVRNFLHLYSAELPFQDRDTLPKETIQSVTLVDTQSLVTIKGLNKNTVYHVIDHHQQKEDSPENWHFNYVDTGSTTTHFVQQLQELEKKISLVHATLLLLGIYEDTGSLTYANTTSRDAQAVAYLLDCGASLKIAAEFLNPPLSPTQRAVFDNLVDQIETITIKDCHVMLAFTSAEQLDEEISSIAHKIMDLYDPDALFIFVETKEGIRLVARSVSDQINVAVISQQFNGGGHERAAAALIKRNPHNKTQLEDIYHFFKRELNEYIKPGVTVKQIMSKKPLLIQPETTAEQAYQLMQRFGYEGYPVVEDKKIKGLLTRRAVDRALSHKLNLTASNLMEAGNVSVSPTDSLGHLHQIMADSGWGQIPVVDPESGEIVGIATRTDLLKTLAGKENGNGHFLNLSSKIRLNIPKTHQWLLEKISITAFKMNLPIYLVGGFARDLLLNSASLDLDFVVEGDAIQLAQTLGNELGGRVISHKKFGTAKWLIAEIREISTSDLENEAKRNFGKLPSSIDLISARTEYYEKPTALPTVKTSSIKLDLLRRDFTINTMAIRIDGNHFGDLYDYWGGHADLKKGLVRVLHSLSFVDDPTRVLRAVRFEQRFGFTIEERTLELLSQAINLLSEVSGDRIRHELDQILEEKRATSIFKRMQQLGILEQIHPHFTWDQSNSENLDNFLGKEIPDEWGINSIDNKRQNKVFGAYIILFASLNRPILTGIIERLKLKNHLKHMLLSANELNQKVNNIRRSSPSQITRLLEKYPLLVVYCVYFLLDDQALKNRMADYVLKWRFIKSHSDGSTLKGLGLKPGPQFGEIINILRDKWLDGDITSDEGEIEYLHQIIKSRPDLQS